MKYVYVGRKKCGCVVAVTSGEQDLREVARSVSEFIIDGLTVHHVSFEKYKSVVSKEDTFLNCPHVQKQEELF